jgi:hypothetical protein
MAEKTGIPLARYADRLTHMSEERFDRFWGPIEPRKLRERKCRGIHPDICKPDVMEEVPYTPFRKKPDMGICPGFFSDVEGDPPGLKYPITISRRLAINAVLGTEPMK